MHPGTIRFHKRRETLLVHYGYKCSNCGSTLDLEFHMIEQHCGRACGGWQHLREIESALLSNNPIELLCRACHLKTHRQKENNIRNKNVYNMIKNVYNMIK